MSGNTAPRSCKMPVALYRHFDAAGLLLYVGQSANPFQRAISHKCRTTWMYEVAKVSIEWFADRKSAQDAELVAIAAERPKHNIDVRKLTEFDDWPSPLGRYLRHEGLSSIAFAKSIGKAQSVVRRWCRGEKLPSTASKARIAEVTGGSVPVCSWEGRQ